MAPVGFSPSVDDVDLSWSAVNGAAWYELQVAMDSQFASLVDPAPDGQQTSVKVLGTHYSPLTTYDNGTYYWRVRAIDTNGNASPWPEQVGHFTRGWPDTPQTVFPADDDDQSLVTQQMPPAPYFQWTPVRLATHYEIQVGTNENFSPGTYQTCQVAGTTYTPQMFWVNNDTGQTGVREHEDCWIDPDITMYWRVRPLDLPYTKFGALVPGVQGIFSETEQFVWRPQLGASFSPSGGETVDIPTLRWDFPREAERYRVEIKDAYGLSVGMAVTTRSKSYTPVNVAALQPNRGPFTWTVTGYDAEGPRIPGELGHRASLTYSNTFNVSGNDPDSGAAALTPLTGLESDAPTLRAPALSWEPHPDAKTYKLYVGPADDDDAPGPTSFAGTFDDAYGKPLPYPAVTDTGKRFLTAGSYDWWVEAIGMDGASLGLGPEETFRIKGLWEVTGQSLAVDGSTVGAGNGCAATKPALCDQIPSTPVLSWEPVEGATYYMVYIGEGAFTNVVEPLTNVTTVANTKWAPSLSQAKSALKDSEANQAYHWFIRPCKGPGVCGPSPISSPDVAVNQFRKVSPRVKLLAPANAAVITEPDITLDWEDYLTTSQGTTWFVTGERGPQAAQRYRVQIDNDQEFTSPLEAALVDQSKFTSSTKLYREGILWWRVQAIDADGNDLPWSQPRYVKKQTPDITTEWPTTGSTVSGNVDFRWRATSSTARYELEVWNAQCDTNGCKVPESDTARRLFQAKNGYTLGVKQTAYTWDKPIPASGGTYIWRVRRVDSNLPTANPGPWTIGGTFTSRRSLPSLVSPAASASVPANGPLFTWNPVPGASQYLVQVRGAGATYNWANVTTAATAWAADRTMTAGNWQWRVIAKDAGGAELGTTQWRGFTVPTSSTTIPPPTTTPPPTDTTPPTVVKKTPLTYAKRGANFTARFSEPVKGVSGTTMRLFKGTTRVSARVTLSADRKTATLNPSRLMKRRAKCTLRLTTGIGDNAGNRLRATSWTVRVR